MTSALEAVAVELANARSQFHPFASPHEGVAVIREEYLELERLVFADTGRMETARGEAIQLAAMAVRYVEDLCDV